MSLARGDVDAGRASFGRAGAQDRPTASASASGRGFHPATRRRNRIAAGVLLAAIAVGGNALVYSSIASGRDVVQVVEDVPAGTRITPDMLRTVEVDADATVNVVPAEQLDALVGRYAKVRLVSGSLVVAEALQDEPLVAPETAIVALQVDDGTLPVGLRERVPIVLVIPATGDAVAPTSIDGRVVGLPQAAASALGRQSLSVEVARADAATVAAADDVRVVLVEPTPDPADQASRSTGEDGG